MFNFIVAWAGSGKIGNSGELHVSRIFEYTDENIKDFYKKDVNITKLIKFPCLFMIEGKTDEKAAVGMVNSVKTRGNKVFLKCEFDSKVSYFKNSFFYSNRQDLDIDEFEFSRNHWAVKDVDLYRFLLLKDISIGRQRPSVFSIPKHESIKCTSSAMMPFDKSFDKVYESIQIASKNLSLECKRADDIWENQSIIQDVVSLIDRSCIVVCDCTGRNLNVFYEVGIAHTLGREVILITQADNDIPFDLKHIRYLKYLNNSEGLTELTKSLEKRMKEILKLEIQQLN